MRGRSKSKPDKKPTELAYDKALSLLVRREHSARELKTKLARRGMEAADSEKAVAELAAKDFQNDGRFGEMLVRSRLEGGYGERWIVAELRTHGIAEEQARALVAAAEPDWTQLVRRQLQRRYGARRAASVMERDKRAGYLLRRGFDPSAVKLVTRAEGFDDTLDESD